MKQSKNISNQRIAQLSQECSARAIEIRHELHKCPETRYEEEQTARLIRAELDQLGIAYQASVDDAPTATIGLIGDAALPCVAIRADIDALPIEEESDLPYRSRSPGRMHACGHDGHMAALLGAAAVLKRLESELPVCVKLLFQPAEECGGGAERLVNAGVLDGRLGPRVQAVFGLHGWPTLPIGRISTRPGPLMAATDNFTAVFHGKGGHGAYPHLGRDPIVAASEAVLSLQQIVSREVNPVDSAVVTVGQLHAGTTFNIIPETAMIQGTARTLSPEMRSAVRAAISRRLSGIAAANDARLEFRWDEGYPATINDPAMAAYVAEMVARQFGRDRFADATAPSMAGEDFAYYLQQTPGCFIFLGLGPVSGENGPGLHHPRFNFNDAVLPDAIQLLVTLATGPIPQTGA